MEEVPIFFPTLPDESVVRYRLHLDNDDSDNVKSTPTCYVTRYTAVEDPPSGTLESSLGTVASLASKPSFPGAATVSRLGSTTNHVLTTVLLVDEPTVLSVSVLLGTGSESANSVAGATATFELDVSPCAPHYQATAKVHASFHDDDDSTVQLILVDREGMVLRVVCDWWDSKNGSPSLVPVSASFHNWRLHVPTSVVDHVTPHPLNRARVAFLSSSRILMALNPYLLVLEFVGGAEDATGHGDDKVTIWSKDETRINMESRKNWSRRLSMFARAVPEPGSIIDMAAVSALTVASNSSASGSSDSASTNSDATATVVCTLHCDGTVHVWTVKRGTASPHTVAEVVPRSLPPTAEWASEDAHDRRVPILASRVYPKGRIWACALYVPTTSSSRWGGELSVLHGSMDDVANPTGPPPNLEEVSLDVVEGVTSLISMEFDSKNEDKCSLLTWFHQDQSCRSSANDRDSPCGTVCATYPPSHTSILCSQPVVLSDWDGMLDRYAWKERSRLQALQPLRSIYESESLEAALYALDRQFLQQVFRPASSASAVTPPRAPTARFVRNAMRVVAGSARLGAIVSELGAAPVETEVLVFLHRWRERENRRRGFSSRPVPGMSTDPSHDAMDTDHVSEKQEELAKEVDLHATRWKTLLLAIWAEQQSLRDPLLVSTYTGSDADVAITVRGGAISVVVPPNHSSPQIESQTSLAKALDRASIDAVSFIANDKNLLALLVEAESGLTDLVASGDLAIKDSTTDLRFFGLKNVVEQLQKAASPLRQYSETIATLMSSVSEGEVIATLEDVSMDPTTSSPLEERQDTSPRVSHQALLATSSTTGRRLESIHDQLLGRVLVVSAVCPTEERFLDASMRMYLRSITLRWALSQMVTLPLHSGLSSFHDQQPKVRALDAVLHHEFGSKGIGFIDPTSRSSLLNELSRKVVSECFPVSAASSGSTIELPETRIIDAVSPQHSRLHLVLLSPNLAIYPANEEPVVFEKRKMEVALCLISRCASEGDDRTRVLVNRAFDLLSVELDSMETTSIRIEAMSKHISSAKHPLVSSMYLSFLQNVIASMEVIRAPAAEIDRLWSASFNLSVAEMNWERAFQASVGFSQAHQRKASLKHLVLAMVHNGAVEELQSLCEADGVPDGHPQAMMYEAAVEALEGTTLDDRRYNEALYVLHEGRGDWCRAAEALDTEYWKTLDKLRQLSTAGPLDDDSARLRRQTIVSDLVYLALAVNRAISCVPEGEKYLIAAPRVHQAADGAKGDQLELYFSQQDLALRSALVSGVATLLSSGASPQVADMVLLDGGKPTLKAVERFCELLLSHGYFDQALLVASHFSATALFHENFFHECLHRTLCRYLVPLSLGKITEPLPSLEQLADSLDVLLTRRTTNMPPLLAARRSMKVSDMRGHCVRTYAMALLQGLTTAYSSASNTIALDVARTFLIQEFALPAWLDSLLLWGAPSHRATGAGLFARRRVHQQSSSDEEDSVYLGDPAMLLHYYVESGRYLDACRVVTSLLEDEHRRRGSGAPNRLPEKGDIDYLPYDKIDKLWNLVEASAKLDSVKNPGRARLLREAQGNMKQALEDHFRLLKVSEEGLLSARAMRM